MKKAVEVFLAVLCILATLVGLFLFVLTGVKTELKINERATAVAVKTLGSDWEGIDRHDIVVIDKEPYLVLGVSQGPLSPDLVRVTVLKKPGSEWEASNRKSHTPGWLKRKNAQLVSSSDSEYNDLLQEFRSRI